MGFRWFCQVFFSTFKHLTVQGDGYLQGPSAGLVSKFPGLQHHLIGR